MKVTKCPVCKSNNITWFMGGVTGEYTCKDCNYRGPIIIEEDIKKFKKSKRNS